jgi:hypothetical protein
MIMANEKKLTKAQKYDLLLAIEEVNGNPVLKEFVEHEKELLASKNAKKSSEPTKAQKENAELAQTIYDGMEVGKAYKCADIAKAIPECVGMSTQKISPIMRNHEDVLWVKVVEKRVTMYKKIVAED